MNIVKQCSAVNATYYPNRRIKYIVIHYTAGASSATGQARNTAMWFANPAAGGSADFVVDDTQIVQVNPDLSYYYMWHAGIDYSGGKAPYWGKCTNANSIGIEICSTNSNYSKSDPANSTKWSFTSAAVARAVELTKYLMELFKIPTENVIRHWDVCAKPCPGIRGWNTYNGSTEEKWLAFKKQIGSTATATVKPAATTATTGAIVTPIYRVRKSASDSKSQIGAFAVLSSAKKMAEKHNGYEVYDMNGKLVYDPKAASGKKTVAEVAREVINGKWGNGNDRKNRLTAAGYDYTAVQAEVNKILS